jgi:hypothetical protein
LNWRAIERLTGAHLSLKARSRGNAAAAALWLTHGHEADKDCGTGR